MPRLQRIPILPVRPNLTSSFSYCENNRSFCSFFLVLFIKSGCIQTPKVGGYFLTKNDNSYISFSTSLAFLALPSKKYPNSKLPLTIFDTCLYNKGFLNVLTGLWLES